MMRRKSYQLVFPGGTIWLTADREPLSKALDDGDEVFALDGNVAFLRTSQELEALLERLRCHYFQDAQFLLTDITDASRAGNMLPAFWNRFSAAREDAAA